MANQTSSPASYSCNGQSDVYKLDGNKIYNNLYNFPPHPGVFKEFKCDVRKCSLNLFCSCSLRTLAFTDRDQLMLDFQIPSKYQLPDPLILLVCCKGCFNCSWPYTCRQPGHDAQKPDVLQFERHLWQAWQRTGKLDFLTVDPLCQESMWWSRGNESLRMPLFQRYSLKKPLCECQWWDVGSWLRSLALCLRDPSAVMVADL